MARGAKIIISLCLIFIVVLVGIYVFVSVYFTPQRLKALIVPRLSERLGREVALKQIRFNLFKGLEVKKLVIKERSGLPSEKFIFCDNLVLKYKFWPLLRGRIEIASLVLERPFIKIVKDKEGHFNFADITARFKKEKQEEKPAPPSASVKKKAALAFFVSEVDIKDGEVLFKDLQTNRKIHFTHFNLKASDIGWHRPFPLSLSTLVNNFLVKINGKINPQTLAASLQMKASGDNFSSLMAFSPPTIKHLTGKAELNMNLTAAGLEKVQFKGRLSGQDIHVVLRSGQKFVHLNPIISYTGFWNGKTQRLTLENVKVSLNGFSAKARGFIMHLLDQPFFNLNIEASGVNIEKLMALSSAGQGKGVSKKSVHGQAKPQVEPGPLHLPFSADGQIKVEKLFYKQLVVKSLSTVYNLNHDILTLSKIQGALQKGGTIKGDVKVDLGKEGFAYKVNLHLDRMDVNNINFLIPSSVGMMQGKGSLNMQLEGQGITPPSLEKYLNGQVQLALTDGKFSGNPVWQSVARFLDVDALANPEFKAFNTDMRIRNGKINIHGKANERNYGLNLKGQATVMGKLNLLARIRLNHGLVQRSKSRQLFAIVPKDKNGDYLIPLLIKGEIKAPKVTLDKKAVEAMAKKKLKKLLKEKLPLKNIPFFK